MSKQSALIPDDVIDAIRERVSILDVAERYLGDLKRAGSGWKVCCPWHDDSHPSMAVTPSRGTVRCFVCDRSADIFALVADRENISFPEAVRLLGQWAGVEVPDTRAPRDLPGAARSYAVRDQRSPAAPSQPRERKKRDGGDAPRFSREQYLWVMRSSADFYSASLASAPEAVGAYLSARGFSAAEIALWGIGWAPDAFGALREHLRGLAGAKAAGALACACACGLLKQGDDGRPPFDRLRGRIIFPICDEQGRPVALGGRIFDDAAHPKAAKYLNTDETPIFRKGAILYGMHLAKAAISETGTAILVEGYVDAIAMHRAGKANTVATMGTAFTVDHAAVLKRVCGTVVTFMDSDAAGQKATARIGRVCRAVGLTVLAATLAQNKTEEAKA